MGLLIGQPPIEGPILIESKNRSHTIIELRNSDPTMIKVKNSEPTSCELNNSEVTMSEVTIGEPTILIKQRAIKALMRNILIGALGLILFTDSDIE